MSACSMACVADLEVIAPTAVHPTHRLLHELHRRTATPPCPSAGCRWRSRTEVVDMQHVAKPVRQFGNMLATARWIRSTPCRDIRPAASPGPPCRYRSRGLRAPRFRGRAPSRGSCPIACCRSTARTGRYPLFGAHAGLVVDQCIERFAQRLDAQLREPETGDDPATGVVLLDLVRQQVCRGVARYRSPLPLPTH